MMCRRVQLLVVALLLFLPAVAQLNTERVMLIGRNALYFEDYVLSIQYFNKVIEAKPYLHEPYFFRGLAKFYLDDYKGADEDISKAIEINPYVSRSYQLRGMCRAKCDSIALAVADFRMAIKYDSQNPQLWQNLAAVMMQGEEWGGAASVTDSLLLFSPRYTTAYLMRAHIAVKQEDTLTAVRMADAAVSIDTYSCDAYEVRAMVHAQYARYAEAEGDYTRAIELLPARAGNYINRALVRYHQNNLRGAMEDYDTALRIEPSSFIGHYNRGLLRMQLGDDNSAIEDFDFVLGVDADNTMARFNRALLLDETGDTEAAIADYSRVLSDYPNFEYGYRCRAAALRRVGKVKAAEKDEAWLLERAAAVQAGRLAAQDSEADDKTRKRSDRNVANYNKMIAADEFERDYSTEYRGRVQDRNTVVELEPLFALTYYEDEQELRSSAYYAPVAALHGENIFPARLLLTNRERALAAHEVERHFKSIGNLSKKISEEPHSMQPFLARAIDFYLVQDLTSALADLNEAEKVGGDDMWLLYMLRAVVRCRILESEHINKEKDAASLSRRGVNTLPDIDYRLAKSDLDALLSIAPGFAYGFFNRANVYVKLSDFKSAVVDYTAAIELDDKFAEAYYNRGLARIYLGNVQGGVADLSKAGELGIYAAYNVIKRYKDSDSK